MTREKRTHRNKPVDDSMRGLDPHDPGKDRFGNDVDDLGNELDWTGGGTVGKGARRKRQCRAAKRRTDDKERCRANALSGKLYCKNDGGATHREVAVASVVHGRYSKYLGAKNGEDYDAALLDEELLDMRHHVALLDAVVKRSAELAHQRDTPEFRRRALGLFNESQEHMRKKDATEAAHSISQLGKLLNRGVAESRAYDSLTHKTVELSKRVEATWHVRFKGADMISKARFDMLLLDIVGTIAEVITDGKLATRLVQRIRARVSGPRD